MPAHEVILRLALQLFGNFGIIATLHNIRSAKISSDGQHTAEHEDLRQAR